MSRKEKWLGAKWEKRARGRSSGSMSSYAWLEHEVYAGCRGQILEDVKWEAICH